MKQSLLVAALLALALSGCPKPAENTDASAGAAEASVGAEASAVEASEPVVASEPVAPVEASAGETSAPAEASNSFSL